MENRTNWYTIDEVNRLCFNSSISRRSISNILFELPLIEERRGVIINHRKYNLLCYKYSEKLDKININS